MKKVFPILLAIALFATACQLGGNEGPEVVALPTTAPTLTPIPLNAPVDVSAKNVEAGEERVSPVDGMIQVYIPQGSFQMGGIDPRAGSDEKPLHKVDMKGYWIDKVEVTNAMYLLCVQAGACNPPQALASETRPSYFNNPEYNNFPVVNVTWDSAKQYCTWAGRRMLTEAEWEYAARGNTINTYPWGDQKPDASRANFNYMVGDTNMVGSYPSGASPFGVLDMSGNVMEWIQDFYGTEYYNSGSTSNPTGPLARTSYFNRVVRGGSYADPEAEIRLANRASTLGPDYQAELGSKAYLGEFSPRIGFRCAAD